MPAMDTNLTRAEALERSALIEVASYDVALDLGDAARAETFESVSTVRFGCRRPGASSWIDLIADEILSAELNGAPLDTGAADGARLPLPDLAAENVLSVRARCGYMRTGEGLHRVHDPADDATYLYTQLATADARRVLACFDQPDLKARFRLTATVPAGWEAASNTPPAARAEHAGRATWVFEPTPPLPTYLVALVAGPFAIVRSSYDGPHGRYPLGLLTRRSAAHHLDAEEVFSIIRAGLAHFEAELAPAYPFGKYDHVMLPEFNFGAMENPGLVIFREDLALFRSRATEAQRERRAMVILHEMAHMWFGDLVTMRWWDDLWLNESFAEWAGYRATALATPHTTARTSFALSEEAWAYRQDELPSTHPVVADMADLEAVYLNFDGITYAKGAAVLTQLVAFVGLEPFLRGLNAYFAEFAWGNATLADLLDHLGRASGRDLGPWAAAWLTEAGVTTLVPDVDLDGSGRYARVAVTQVPASRPAGVSQVLRPHRVALGLYRWSGRPGERRLVRDQRVEVDLTGAGVDVPELAGVDAADLLLVNDDDLTYAKLGLDPASLATARAGGVAALADPLARALVWGALWESVRDAELPAQEFLALALHALATEGHPVILASLDGWIEQALARFVDPAIHEAVAGRLCAGTRALLDAAEPGSERQLALARIHIGVARDPQRLAALADLVEGRAELPGLPLDDDLRWAVVTRLVARGAAGTGLVDRALAADPSSSGEAWAARARASEPTPAAKQAAWDAVVAGGLPNARVEATMRGWAEPGTPAALLAPFRARYFATIGRIFAERSPAEARRLARGLFPGVCEETVAGARALLAGEDLPSGLRRIVAESADEVERALRCRRRSASAPALPPGPWEVGE